MAPNPPFSTVGGYGGNATLIPTPSGAAAFLDDAMDGYPTLHPQLGPTGALTPFVIDPSTVSPASGLPEINAILIELRVISALLREQMGDMKASYDLQTMRADELWNTNVTTGSL